ncbi:MAG: DUF1343 domain-containing protein [Flavobacteriaceae bacterium]|nr:DUF1343 domain-containing protein [Flavobacteriaceae bacterium]
MRFNFLFKNTLLFLLIFLSACKEKSDTGQMVSPEAVVTADAAISTEVVLAANRFDAYLNLLKGKKVGIVANQTSLVKRADGSYVHLVDTLLTRDVQITKVFAPEHGFRGEADAGEKVADDVDAKTGIEIVSLYGLNRKPSPKQLQNVEVVLFDLQDVGVRFYTYISTLTYVMESCAENKLPLVVLDRPNPNISIIDGPVLDMENRSFVGMHPVPVLHGMTLGEYAKMVNAEKWLMNEVQAELTVIPMEKYTRTTSYNLPIKPSPNLPNDLAVNLYASLCFFEGTNVSVGRGTDKQFQLYGSPDLPSDTFTFSFTPQPNEGAKNPLHMDVLCYGEDLSETAPLKSIELKWLMNAYQATADKSSFFNKYFVKLAGTDQLQKQIEAGVPAEQIYQSWQEGIEAFKSLRAPYLIYN